MALLLSLIQPFIQQTLIPVVLRLWQASAFPEGLIKAWDFWALLPEFLIQ